VPHEDNAAPDERPAAADGTAGPLGDALRASEQQFGREFGRAPVGLVTASLSAGRGCACMPPFSFFAMPLAPLDLGPAGPHW